MKMWKILALHDIGAGTEQLEMMHPALFYEPLHARGYHCLRPILAGEGDKGRFIAPHRDHCVVIRLPSSWSAYRHRNKSGGIPHMGNGDRQKAIFEVLVKCSRDLDPEDSGDQRGDSLDKLIQRPRRAAARRHR